MASPALEMAVCLAKKLLEKQKAAPGSSKAAAPPSKPSGSKQSGIRPPSRIATKSGISPICGVQGPSKKPGGVSQASGLRPPSKLQQPGGVKSLAACSTPSSPTQPSQQKEAHLPKSPCSAIANDDESDSDPSMDMEDLENTAMELEKELKSLQDEQLSIHNPDSSASSTDSDSAAVVKTPTKTTKSPPKAPKRPAARSRIREVDIAEDQLSKTMDQIGEIVATLQNVIANDEETEEPPAAEVQPPERSTVGKSPVEQNAELPVLNENQWETWKDMLEAQKDLTAPASPTNYCPPQCSPVRMACPSIHEDVIFNALPTPEKDSPSNTGSENSGEFSPVKLQLPDILCDPRVPTPQKSTPSSRHKSPSPRHKSPSPRHKSPSPPPPPPRMGHKIRFDEASGNFIESCANRLGIHVSGDIIKKAALGLVTIRAKLAEADREMYNTPYDTLTIVPKIVDSANEKIPEPDLTTGKIYAKVTKETAIQAQTKTPQANTSIKTTNTDNVLVDLTVQPVHPVNAYSSKCQRQFCPDEDCPNYNPLHKEAGKRIEQPDQSEKTKLSLNGVTVTNVRTTEVNLSSGGKKVPTRLTDDFWNESYKGNQKIDLPLVPEKASGKLIEPMQPMRAEPIETWMEENKGKIPDKLSLIVPNENGKVDSVTYALQKEYDPYDKNANKDDTKLSDEKAKALLAELYYHFDQDESPKKSARQNPFSPSPKKKAEYEANRQNKLVDCRQIQVPPTTGPYDLVDHCLDQTIKAQIKEKNTALVMVESNDVLMDWDQLQPDVPKPKPKAPTPTALGNVKEKFMAFSDDESFGESLCEAELLDYNQFEDDNYNAKNKPPVCREPIAEEVNVCDDEIVQPTCEPVSAPVCAPAVEVCKKPTKTTTTKSGNIQKKTIQSRVDTRRVPTKPESRVKIQAADPQLTKRVKAAASKLDTGMKTAGKKTAATTSAASKIDARRETASKKTALTTKQSTVSKTVAGTASKKGPATKTSVKSRVDCGLTKVVKKASTAKTSPENPEELYKCLDAKQKAAQAIIDRAMARYKEMQEKYKKCQKK